VKRLTHIAIGAMIIGFIAAVVLIGVFAVPEWQATHRAKELRKEITAIAGGDDWMRFTGHPMPLDSCKRHDFIDELVGLRESADCEQVRRAASMFDAWKRALAETNLARDRLKLAASGALLLVVFSPMPLLLLTFGNLIGMRNVIIVIGVGMVVYGLTGFDAGGGGRGGWSAGWDQTCRILATVGAMIAVGGLLARRRNHETWSDSGANKKEGARR
jgi:hypothetical protein